MPTFANREALSSVRAKLNSAIEWIDAYGVMSVLSYSNLAEFQAAVTAGLSLPDGRFVAVAGAGYVAEAGAVIAGIPAGWRPVDWVYTRAELEAATWDVAPGLNVINILESGFVVPYVRTPFATDLIAGDLSEWEKAGINAADAVQIGLDVALAAAVVTTADIYATYGGTADAITLATGKPFSTVPTGARIRFRATAANTGAATVSVDGLPAIALRTVTGVALPAGYIRTGVDTAATFNGTYWVLDRATERGGTDADGYERFANGTLRVWKNLSGLGPISTANGSLFNSSVITVGTLAADFLTGTVPSMIVFGRGGSVSCWAQGIADPVGGVGSTGGTFQLFRATSAAATTYKADCKYEGVWF